MSRSRLISRRGCCCPGLPCGGGVEGLGLDLDVLLNGLAIQIVLDGLSGFLAEIGLYSIT